MAQREGSIYLGLFVASFILFATMVAVVFFLQGDIEKLKQDLSRKDSLWKNEQSTNRKLSDQLEDLRVLIAGEGARDAGNWPGNAFYIDILKTSVDEFNRINKTLDPNAAARSFDFLSQPYSELIDILKALQEVGVKTSSEAETYRALLADGQKLQKETLASLDEKRVSLNQQLVESEAKREDEENACRQNTEELSARVADLEETVEKLEKESQRMVAFKDNTISRLKIRIELLLKEIEKIKTIDDIEPDGRIVDVEGRSKIAWVDLGRRDNLRPGLVFKVFQYVGGKKVWKGSIEISRVDDKLSQVSIIEERNSLNPIAANDQIASPYYDRNDAPVFVFAGDSSRINLPIIRRKLESLGARVDADVSVETDFLVALDNYEGTTEFLAARELSVTVMRERDLLSYLGR